MLNRITHPEELLPTEAETCGQQWIESQRNKYGGLTEVVRSFFSTRNVEHSVFTNFLFKYGGLTLTGASVFGVKSLERSDRPEFYAAVLLITGLVGLATTTFGTQSSMDKRREDRERKRKPYYV